MVGLATVMELRGEGGLGLLLEIKEALRFCLCLWAQAKVDCGNFSDGRRLNPKREPCALNQALHGIAISAWDMGYDFGLCVFWVLTIPSGTGFLRTRRRH